MDMKKEFVTHGNQTTRISIRATPVPKYGATSLAFFAQLANHLKADFGVSDKEITVWYYTSDEVGVEMTGPEDVSEIPEDYKPVQSLPWARG